MGMKADASAYLGVKFLWAVEAHEVNNPPSLLYSPSPPTLSIKPLNPPLNAQLLNPPFQPPLTTPPPLSHDTNPPPTHFTRHSTSRQACMLYIRVAPTSVITTATDCLVRMGRLLVA